MADPLPTGLSYDALLQLLPFSEASGIRYRYGIRIIDTNRFANLNVGAAIADNSGVDPSGTYLGSYALGRSSDIFNPADTMANLDASWGRTDGAPGLTAMLASPSAQLYYAWSHIALGFEQPTGLGSYLHGHSIWD